MIYAFFPFFAAALYGLSYVLMERVTGIVNLTTYYVTSCMIFLVFALGHGLVKGEGVSYDFAKQSPSLLLLLFCASAAGSVAWFFTTYAMKNISASYAAFGEISYPLFTLFFAFALFGLRQWDWHIIAGGLLILAGSFVLIYGQSKAPIN